ncbi:MADF domain-containing protein [Aphelenchoides bicaudatus]|nr:MADF domain-containing protein [Aphelenchoides bicaudatus]
MTQQEPVILGIKQVTEGDRFKLIKLVSERPMIWDSNATKDKSRIQTDWQNIALWLSTPGRNFDVALAKKMWTYLRGQYMKIMKSGKDSTWQYLEPLAFLSGLRNVSSGAASGDNGNVKADIFQEQMMRDFMPPDELTEDAMEMYVQQMRTLGFLPPMNTENEFEQSQNAEMRQDNAFQQPDQQMPVMQQDNAFQQPNQQMPVMHQDNVFQPPTQFFDKFALDQQMPQFAQFRQQMLTMPQFAQFQQPNQFASDQQMFTVQPDQFALDQQMPIMQPDQFALDQQMLNMPQFHQQANGGPKVESRKRSQTHLADSYETPLYSPENKRAHCLSLIDSSTHQQPVIESAQQPLHDHDVLNSLASETRKFELDCCRPSQVRW